LPTQGGCPHCHCHCSTAWPMRSVGQPLVGQPRGRTPPDLMTPLPYLTISLGHGCSRACAAAPPPARLIVATHSTTTNSVRQSLPRAAPRQPARVRAPVFLFSSEEDGSFEGFVSLATPRQPSPRLPAGLTPALPLLRPARYQPPPVLSSPFAAHSSRLVFRLRCSAAPV